MASELPKDCRRLHWPEDLDHFAVNEKTGELYWDGKRIKAEIALNRWQWIVTAITAGVLFLSQATTTIKNCIDIWHSQRGTANSHSHKICSPKEASVRMVDLGCVGPFLPASDSPPVTSRYPCITISELQRKIKSQSGQGVFFVFLGSSDKFGLGISALRTYGSNEGLAQARAESVVRELRIDARHVPDKSPTVLKLMRGPTLKGSLPEQTAPDRSVTVYGLWSSASP